MELLDGATCSGAVKKCKVSEFREEDRISCIPDPVLAYILSMLPTNDAVKTMLIKPFGKLWTTMSILDFYVCLFDDLPTTPPMHRWFSFVDHVLLHHEAPTVTKFRLKFGRTIYSSGLKSGQIVEKIDSWIDFAVRKNVEVLEVDIGRRCRYEPIFAYALPSSVLKSDTLTELHVASCSWITAHRIHMKSLKTLSLRTITLDDTLMERILSGCPSLETLIIIDCHGLNLLKLPRVKDLKITRDESEMSLLEISAPNLNSISVSGAIGFVDLKVSSTLSVATLDFFRGGKSFINRPQNIWILLSYIKHAEYVRVCHWCLLVLAIREWHDWLSLTRKSVVVETRPTRWHFLGIKSLLRSSPKLEVLTVFIERDTFLFTQDDMMHQAIGSVINRSKMRITANFNEMCSHLKIVNIRGYVLNSFAIQLVKFLLRSSTCLEEVVISSECRGQGNQLGEYHVEKSLILFKELLHCARAQQVIVRLGGLNC